MHRTLPLLALLLNACASDDSTPAPYKDGLAWVVEEQVTSTTQSWRQVEGEEPLATSGLIGTAARCADARTSAGTSVTTAVTRRTLRGSVLGQTVSHHPLAPGDDTFDAIGVSVVEEQVTETGSATNLSSFFSPGAAQETWETSSTTDLGTTVVSHLYGVAADEYVVKLEPLDLWTDDSAEDGRAWSLMTRAGAKPGDLWTNPTGTSVFEATRAGSAGVGSKKVGAVEVSVTQLEDVAATGGTVLADCVALGTRESTSSLDGAPDDVLVQTASLIAGCDGPYEAARVGTELWHDDFLVQFTGTRTFVTISNFGWERFVDDGVNCTRVVTNERPTDTNSAQLFVEYTITTEETLRTTTGYGTTP
jgi:hypothetical protein